MTRRMSLNENHLRSDNPEPVTLSTCQRNEGLPANRSQGILQTRDGFLWLATPRGLGRFDGLHFEVFDRLSTPGLANHI
jgi:ligand-binding sensor domain-containing protein